MCVREDISVFGADHKLGDELDMERAGRDVRAEI